MASVCIDVNISEFTTGELIEELRRRRTLTRQDLIELSPKAIVGILEEFGCPQVIIKQLQEWANQPVVTIHKLIAWKEACVG
jgi:uncharacterized protein HemY